MNSRDVCDSDAGASKEAERAKKIYRYVSETARRIDEAIPACKTIGDLFTTHMEGLRQKIRDNCEKLMFADPLAYGRKALELLWRKAYYETVCLAKKLKANEDIEDNYVFSHLVCGIGHYHHLISKIITEMDVNITTLDYPPMTNDDEATETVKNVDDDIRQWGASIIHSCLIYLGDLSRYQTEIFEGYDASIAARYYLQAANLDLSSGMPYNQLGNLYTDRNHNLDSICYYIHCLSCAVPFEGADGNLARLFEKNAQYLETVDQEHTDEFEPAERVKLTIARVLALTNNWFNVKQDDNIAQLCNLAASDLKVCLSYNEPTLPDIQNNYKEYVEMKYSEVIFPSYLNPDIVYKMVQICLFCIHKLNESDASKVFAVKAFTLALFSQLLQKFLEQLQKLGFHYQPRRKSILNMSSCDNNNEKCEEPIGNGVEEENADKPEEKQMNGVLSDHEEQKVNGSVKVNGKKPSAKRRRRRRVNNTDSSEESEDESGLESEMSSDRDDDNSSQSGDSYYSDGTNDDNTDNENKEHSDVKVDKDIAKVNNEIEHTVIKENKFKKEICLNEKGIQNFLRGHNYLPSLKLLQDWALNETDLILSCGESGDALFQSVVDLLNILQSNFTGKSKNKYEMPACKILDYAKSASAKLEIEFNVLPLPEDVHLRGTDICKFDKDAAEWELLKKYSPNVYEENIIRILNFIRFGNQIAKIVPRIRYNRSMQVFFLKKNHLKAKLARKEIKKKPQRSPPKAGRHGADTTLMRSLGRLWLQSQVRELESAVRGGARETLPAYLVLDTEALATHTHLVKQLVKARKFVVLVPTVVLQSIDELKKEVGGARDAIRWLESQLQSGSRFLRTQRPNETKPLPLIKYPRKAPKQVHNFVQIIEFCHHFVANDIEIGDGDRDKPPEKKSHTLLVLLTGNKISDNADEQKDFSYSGVAQSAGVAVDSIVHFFAKWKHLISKPGHKR